MQKHSTPAYNLHLQHNKPGHHPSRSQWSSDGAGRKPSQAGGFPSLQSVPTATLSTKRSSAPTVTGILTASASAFSLETLPPATTDSKAETQRCLSGKLGASKYRVLPGQQVVCGWDSIFSMYGTSRGFQRAQDWSGCRPTLSNRDNVMASESHQGL